MQHVPGLVLIKNFISEEAELFEAILQPNAD